MTNKELAERLYDFVFSVDESISKVLAKSGEDEFDSGYQAGASDVLDELYDFIAELERDDG